MNARSIKGKSTDDIRVALDQALEDGFRPTLAVLFLSVKQDWEAVLGVLEEKDIQVFGATTAGEFIDGDIGEASIAVLLLDMDPAYFKLVFIEIDPGTAFEDAKALGGIAKESFDHPAVRAVFRGIYGDPGHSSVNFN